MMKRLFAAMLCIAMMTSSCKGIDSVKTQVEFGSVTTQDISLEFARSENKLTREGTIYYTIINNEWIYYWDSDEKIVLSQRLFCVRVKKEYHPRFVYYYMTTEDFQGEMDGRATGTTVVGLRQPELMKCELYCPDFDTQKKIASILASIDAKIDTNSKINDNLAA